ncbi:hypothetical protein TIFTF001_048144 [Ficus carica]|uniref:Uncharacterized protein n=1 Tax=Ficus carica TaxID=3494 RepID=A0AA87ZS44_FICCA|nr:hypothetical protein TIFTF001_048144 [Ficus carica]
MARGPAREDWGGARGRGVGWGAGSGGVGGGSPTSGLSPRSVTGGGKVAGDGEE